MVRAFLQSGTSFGHLVVKTGEMLREMPNRSRLNSVVDFRDGGWAPTPKMTVPGQYFGQFFLNTA